MEITGIQNEQAGDDPGAEGTEGAGGVPDRAPRGPHRQREEQHPGPHQLQVKLETITGESFSKYFLSQEQQKAAGPRQGLRQALQHGAGGRQRDVDRASEERER